MNFNSLFDSAARGWIPVVLLLCLFLALIFRPGHIRNLTLFRLSWIIFAVYLFVPALQSVFNELMGPRPFAGRPNPGAQFEQMFGARNVYFDVVTQILLLISICFGLASLTPSLYRQRAMMVEEVEE